MVDGVGIKRRLVDTQDDGVTTGGASSSSCAGPEVHRGGVRQRLVQSDVSEASGPDGDLVSSLKKDWATGKLSSKKVPEYARGASSQGASGLQGMDRAGGHKAFRFLKNVFGIPAGAPDLTWPEVRRGQTRRLCTRSCCPTSSFHPTSTTDAEGACLEFWRAKSKTQFVLSHPAWMQIVPLGMHDQLELLGLARRDCAKAIRFHSLP